MRSLLFKLPDGKPKQIYLGPAEEDPFTPVG